MIANLVDAALALSQSLELSIVLKATAVVALALVGARLAARARAAVRHLLLASGFAALLALPLAAVSVPKLSINVPMTWVAAASRPTPLAATTPISAAATEPIPTGWDLPSRGAVARTVWIAGVVLCVTPLALTLWRLRQIRRTGLPFAPHVPLPDTHQAARRVQFLQHEDVAAPMTFGLWRPVVVMPPDAREWSAADFQRALIHELEHVRRSDWAVHVLGRLVCAVYWFHPLVWLAGRQLGLEAERACDDAVVASSESTDYAEQLVVLAQRLSAHSRLPLLGMANRSDLAARVAALLDATQRRGRASSGVAAAVVGLAGVVVLGLAPLTAAARGAGGDVVAAAEPRQQGPSTSPRRTRALDRALYEAANDGDLAK